MSRHSIPGLNKHYEVWVGWDPPLGTFFGQVYDTTIEDEDDRLILWVGASRIGAITTTKDLSTRMEGYATLADGTRDLLAMDRIRETESARSENPRDRIREIGLSLDEPLGIIGAIQVQANMLLKTMNGTPRCPIEDQRTLMDAMLRLTKAQGEIQEAKRVLESATLGEDIER